MQNNLHIFLLVWLPLPQVEKKNNNSKPNIPKTIFNTEKKVQYKSTKNKYIPKMCHNYKNHKDNFKLFLSFLSFIVFLGLFDVLSCIYIVFLHVISPANIFKTSKNMFIYLYGHTYFKHQNVYACKFNKLYTHLKHLINKNYKTLLQLLKKQQIKQKIS